MIASLGLGQMGVVNGDLPVALPATPYARFGDLIFAILLVVTATGAALTKVKLVI